MPTLRPYRSTDWDDFIALEVETCMAALPDAPATVRDEFCARWPKFVKSRYAWADAGPTTDASSLLVCEGEAGEYAGHLWLTEQTDFFTAEPVLHITTIAVASSQRQRGIGKMLMEAAVADAKRRGISHVTLGVDASNAAAISLYAGVGFKTKRLAMSLRV
jgi:ribosomal protein S18 acetylase RimI-like enzyme